MGWSVIGTSCCASHRPKATKTARIPPNNSTLVGGWWVDLGKSLVNILIFCVGDVKKTTIITYMLKPLIDDWYFTIYHYFDCLTLMHNRTLLSQCIYYAIKCESNQLRLWGVWDGYNSKHHGDRVMKQSKPRWFAGFLGHVPCHKARQLKIGQNGRHVHPEIVLKNISQVRYSDP